MQVRIGWAAAVAALAIAVMAFSLAPRATAQQAASGQAANEKTEPASSDQASVDLGKAIFAERCSHCHGPNMVNSGTITPDLRRFPDDRPRFVTTVKQGKNNRMPPWGDILSDDDITNLWAYISSRRAQ